MTESIVDLIVQILRAYEEKTEMSCFSIANEMGIEPSNYYLYHEGDGNPTCKTVDKILGVVLARYPDIIEEILEKKLQNLANQKQFIARQQERPLLSRKTKEVFSWHARRDSNPQLPEPESGALSIGLRAHIIQSL